MLIATVNIPVPTSGDGPIASVMNLVGAKTVVLTGFFSGTYVLCASHDNATFVPVLTFDSNGLEEIRQTLAEAYLSVRVRTIASTTPTTVVTLSVSGLSTPGANLFAVLASLPAGASGPQPVFDTAVPFPPTGLESDINFICAGSLLGTIVIEGSTNGVDFNQVGSFQAGPQKRTLLGLSQTLEFSPLPTADKVRYVRINVQGQILGTTTITMGGSIGVGSSPPSSTTLAQAYANGAVALDQMLVLNDIKGGGVVIDGSGAGFTGTNVFDIISVTGGEVAFPRSGGVSVTSAISRIADPSVKWNEADFLASSLTLTGAPAAIAALAMVSVGHGTIQGIGNTVDDAYDLYVDTAPAGSATITRAWSLGVADAIQAQKGLVLGVGLNPPGESDLVIEASATVVSQASTGRLGYLAGGTQAFMVSANGGAYVPLLVGPAPGGFTPGSVPFGGATGALVENNAELFWDNAGKLLGIGTNGPSARLTVSGGAYTDAAGTHDHVLLTATFAPVGGTAAFNVVNLNYTVNQTAGANGTVTGIFLNATETAVGGIHNLFSLQVATVSRFNVDRYGNTSITQAAQNALVPTALTVTGGAHTAITSGTEDVGINFNLSATKTWVTSSPTTQREVVIRAPTYNLPTALSKAATLAITGAPIQGSGLLLASYAFWTQSGQIQLDGGTYDNGGNSLVQLGVSATRTGLSGTGTFKLVNLTYTINQTGATGTVTGIFLNATETAVGGTHNLVDLQVGSVSRFKIDRYGNTNITQVAEISLTPTALTVTGGAHTTITASAESVGAKFNFSATKQWTTGAIATQREVLIQAPTYAFTSAATITTAATLAITGAPITGANATITNSLALWIQSGASQFDGITKHSNGTSTAPSITWTTDTTNGLYHTGTGATGAILSTINGVQKTVVSANGFGIGVTSATTILDILQAQNSATIFQHRNTNSGSNAQVAWKLSNDAVNILQIGKVSSNFTGSPTVDINAGYVESIGGPLYLRTTGTDFISFAANDADFMRLQPTGNLILGGSLTDLITSKLVVDGSMAITATTGATWNGINFVSPTVIISGATTPITTLNSFVIGGPTVSSVSAVAITDFFVCRIGSASLAGLASITRNWCLGIDGNTKFDGGQTIKGTDVNVAGPYTILNTDYALEVRRTATAAISINMPSIATAGNGHIVISIDSGYNAAVNNITLVRNGADKINNVAGNYVQNVSGSTIWLKANATTSNWEII